MAKGGFPGMGGNMGNLMKQAQKMQQNMAKVQEELKGKIVEATVGGGVVYIKANAHKEVLELKIKPEAVDPDDVEMLEDMVLAAVNEVIKKAEDISNTEMSKVTGGMGVPGMF
ncbi:MAG: YbaB/EbfC family nucleoid-associated protein [Clostridiales bacterium]